MRLKIIDKFPCLALSISPKQEDKDEAQDHWEGVQVQEPTSSYGWGGNSPSPPLPGLYVWRGWLEIWILEDGPKPRAVCLCEVRCGVGTAIEASNDDFALHIQLQQVLPLSEYTFAYELQLAEIISFSSASNQRDEHFQTDNDPPKQVEYRGGGERRKGKEVDSGLEWLEYCYKTSESVHEELCGICFEDSLPEMFEGLNCLHRYCHSCMTRFIHSRIADRKPQIYCPHDSCGEALTPQECAYFIPAEIFDARSALNLEAQIADCDKVHCPFPDCSALLVKEETEMSMLSVECCFCNRMFCLRCKVPWHADLDC
ncbi:hypothetical protein KI387_006330 [Taxus chinensis]|uniref:RBR-type E3 ubiquitin transferase n=1 Tax=Taxus chinensis TaxID=29808 RepID=A0AA38LLW2_TAXCH|nr:hypothetical protein KI387_006330 [Taxus chinensis]